MEKLITRLQADYPAFQFQPAKKASWSPKDQRITYALHASPKSIWSVLHELGHALCEHASYDSDIVLLAKEVEAWEKACQVGKAYKITISDDHIQDCLDTYRDWLYKRSTCPSCDTHGIQTSAGSYQCYNCRASWQVTSARFCRPYRTFLATNK